MHLGTYLEYFLPPCLLALAQAFQGLSRLALDFFVGLDHVVADFVSFPRIVFLRGLPGLSSPNPANMYKYSSLSPVFVLVLHATKSLLDFGTNLVFQY